MSIVRITLLIAFIAVLLSVLEVSLDSRGETIGILTPSNHRNALDTVVNVSSLEEQEMAPTDEWTYQTLVSADADGDAYPEIYMASRGRLVRYHTRNDTYEELPLKTRVTPQFADLDGDGRLECLYHDHTREAFVCVDFLALEEEWFVNTSGKFDKQPKVVETEEGPCLVLFGWENEVALYAGTGVRLWERAVPGYYDGTLYKPPLLSVGDMEGDNRLEFVVVSFTRKGMLYDILVTIFDLSTGKALREWSTPTKELDIVTSYPLIADIDTASAGLEIAIGSYEGAIWVISGILATTIWERPTQKSSVVVQSFETIATLNGTILVASSTAFLGAVEIFDGSSGQMLDRINNSRDPTFPDLLDVGDFDSSTPGWELCYSRYNMFVVYSPSLKRGLWSHHGPDHTTDVRFLLVHSVGANEVALHIFYRLREWNRTEHYKLAMPYNSETELHMLKDRHALFPNVDNAMELLELRQLPSDPELVVMRISQLGQVSTVEIRRNGVSILNARNDFLVTDVSYERLGERMSIDVSIHVGWMANSNYTYGLDLHILHGDGSVTSFHLDDAFYVEKRIRVRGDLTVTGPGGGVLEQSGWVRGGANLTFGGLWVTFANATVVPNADDVLVVGRSDHGEEERLRISGSGEVQWRTRTPEGLVTDVVYVVSIDCPHTGQGFEFGFNLSVDGIAPGFIDLFPAVGGWYSEGEMTLGCRASDGNGSGIASVELQVVRALDPLVGWGPPGRSSLTDGVLVAQDHRSLQEGTWMIRWRVLDVAGNGPVLSELVTVHVDMTDVEFRSFSPVGWSNRTPVEVSVTVLDTNGSGVDLATVAYSVSTSGLFGFSGWSSLGLEGERDELQVTLELDLPEGVDNYVRFRAADAVGNERMSGAHQVRLDLTPPDIEVLSPGPEDIVDNLGEVECVARIQDPLSGVDDATVSYSYRPVDGEFTDWAVAEGLEGGDFRAMLVFEDALGLEVRWRTSDRVGNLAITEEHAIRVNRPPRVLELRPKSPRTVLEGVPVTFGVQLEDPEGDPLVVTWMLDGKAISNDTEFVKVLPPGGNRVRLLVDDGHGNVLDIPVLVNVVEDTTFFVEPTFYLSLLVAVGVVVAISVYYVRRRRQLGD